MIALLKNDSYFYNDCNNIGDFLISYADYIGIDVKIFEILVESGKMSTEELIKYLNRHSYQNEEIYEIYKLGAKLY